MPLIYDIKVRKYLFDLTFKKYNNPKNRSDVTDHSLSFNLNDYMINLEDYLMDDWKWTILSNDGIDTNFQSVHEDYYGPKYGSICFPYAGNYCRYERDFHAGDSWSIGCYFRISQLGLEAYRNNNDVNYINGFTWTDGGDNTWELRVINATNDNIDEYGAAVYLNSKPIVNCPYGWRPDEWLHIVAQYDSLSETDQNLTLFLNGVKANSTNMRNYIPYHQLRDITADKKFLSDICTFKNVTFGWTQKTFSGIIPFYLDDLFLCSTSVFTKNNNPIPNRRMMELYPPMEIRRKYYYSGHKRVNGASNFYQHSNSTMDKLQGGD